MLQGDTGYPVALGEGVGVDALLRDDRHVVGGGHQRAMQPERQVGHVADQVERGEPPLWVQVRRSGTVWISREGTQRGAGGVRELLSGQRGASAALIGLLFVSIAVAPERIFGSSATARRRTAAGSAFTALLNAFFVSLAALIPTSNLGYTALVMAIIGLVNTLALGRHTWEDRRLGRGLLAYALLPGSLIVYTLQIWYAAQLLRHARDTDALYGLVYLLLPAYSLGLARAWELLGGGNDGLRSLLGLGVGVAEPPPGDAGEGTRPAVGDSGGG